jgi:hypothetical protein
LKAKEALEGAVSWIGRRKVSYAAERRRRTRRIRSRRVLGVFPRLVLVEQRHDLAHHDAHRVVAQFLGDRHHAQIEAAYGLNNAILDNCHARIADNRMEAPSRPRGGSGA